MNKESKSELNVNDRRREVLREFSGVVCDAIRRDKLYETLRDEDGFKLAKSRESFLRSAYNIRKGRGPLTNHALLGAILRRTGFSAARLFGLDDNLGFQENDLGELRKLFREELDTARARAFAEQKALSHTPGGRPRSRFHQFRLLRELIHRLSRCVLFLGYSFPIEPLNELYDQFLRKRYRHKDLIAPGFSRIANATGQLLAWQRQSTGPTQYPFGLLWPFLIELQFYVLRELQELTSGSQSSRSIIFAGPSSLNHETFFKDISDSLSDNMFAPFPGGQRTIGIFTVPLETLRVKILQFQMLLAEYRISITPSHRTVDGPSTQNPHGLAPGEAIFRNDLARKTLGPRTWTVNFTSFVGIPSGVLLSLSPHQGPPDGNWNELFLIQRIRAFSPEVVFPEMPPQLNEAFLGKSSDFMSVPTSGTYKGPDGAQ